MAVPFSPMQMPDSVFAQVVIGGVSLFMFFLAAYLLEKTPDSIKYRQDRDAGMEAAIKLVPPMIV